MNKVSLHTLERTYHMTNTETHPWGTDADRGKQRIAGWQQATHRLNNLCGYEVDGLINICGVL